ncbi:MAG: beta-lactamase hydrolase domain-containing protein [Aulosira sp. ZfuVER01]|nr:sulfur transferase domain-containing protein [Aulosira sp. ZfuVER01]MDZ8002804.1 sulfur transferase domain-containing protein [Aulosira sp. DedVER01a]MDZ8054378.1 sulfur transferase domain-containing protein [Aulosira sp. ZfuCHP01]
MDTIKKINDELAIAGQIAPEELKQLAQQGYKSVLNLRSPDEQGFQDSEQLYTQLLGLHYANLPTKLTEINPQIALQVFHKIAELPKPTLIHCDSAVRAIAMVLMYIATKQGMSLEDAFKQAENLGLLEDVIKIKL